MAYPKISIVTPSFNQGQYLERTIQSVINQNYPNLEYIIIDGGSTDGSIDIIKKYEKYLTYWESKKDQGQYHAIQKGFAKSSGDLMAWINSDDIYHSRSLFTVAEIFSTLPEINWLTGNISFIDEEDRIVFSRKANRWSKFNVFNGEYIWIQQESTFWRRTLWEAAGSTLNLELNYAADFDLWIRFFQFERLYTTEALLGAFRIRKKNQKTLDCMPQYMNEYHKIIKGRNITREDGFILKKIKFFDHFILKIPFLRQTAFFKNSFDKFFNYAPWITFDRKSYRYTFKKS
jgi:glycosyltransferase involved in cell wall biosynthesis